MQEKLVENWLISANELTYQIPFCEVLVAKGFDVIHVSTHGRGEHGKDVVARRKGRLFAFQLKGGNIGLSDWRAMREEIAELVELPVRVPGVRESEEFTPYLITNGEIRGDAIEDMVRYRDMWSARGSPSLKVLSRRSLLKMFLDAQGRFLPMDLRDFRSFVELFVSDFSGRVPRGKLAELLEHLGPSGLSTLRTTRALAGVGVIGGIIAECYERQQNYVSAAECWTVVASSVLSVAENEHLPRSAYAPVLTLLSLALDRNLAALVNESTHRENWTEPRFGVADPFVYGARVALVLGWIAVSFHRDQLADRQGPDGKSLRDSILREIPGLRFSGEVDWPFLLLFSGLIRRLVSAASSERLIELWVRAIVGGNGKDSKGIPSPYWLHEKVVSFANGLLPPNEEEYFGGHSYTVMAAMDTLVRRIRRQLVAQLWPQVSQLQTCDFTPDKSGDWFCWRTNEGELITRTKQFEVSWSSWRASLSSSRSGEVPRLLVENPEWIPPFLMTYPHRANRVLSNYADELFG